MQQAAPYLYDPSGGESVKSVGKSAHFARQGFDGIVHLPEWVLLRALGVDAATFLQGQLTQDMMALQPGQACLSGYCSPRGRLLASFVTWRMGADEFGLLCSADLAAAVRKRLFREPEGVCPQVPPHLRSRFDL